jgi:preprotein translocase subunit SecE
MADGAQTPNVLVRTGHFLTDVQHELRKVTWPDRKQLQQATLAIMAFVLLIGALIGVLDVVLNGLLVRLIPSIFGAR